MKFILAGIFFIIVTSLFSLYLTLPFFMFMMLFSAVIMLVGVINEIKGGR
jgi:prepilin signal peptidase PulO-like enzyme (type II secretory pathway)